MAITVACKWAGAVFEDTREFGQEQLGQRSHEHKQIVLGQYLANDTRYPALYDCISEREYAKQWP